MYFRVVEVRDVRARWGQEPLGIYDDLRTRQPRSPTFLWNGGPCPSSRAPERGVCVEVCVGLRVGPLNAAAGGPFHRNETTGLMHPACTRALFHTRDVRARDGVATSDAAVHGRRGRCEHQLQCHVLGELHHAQRHVALSQQWLLRWAPVALRLDRRDGGLPHPLGCPVVSLRGPGWMADARGGAGAYGMRDGWRRLPEHRAPGCGLTTHSGQCVL